MGERKIRLLIAEDEDLIRRSIKNFISNNTRSINEIFEAGNGQETLDCIYQYRPQIMLLDIQMPLKDGLTVLKEATAAGVCPRTIILSCHNEFEYARQAIHYGVADYLLKPCRSMEILKKIEMIAVNEFAAPDNGVDNDAEAENAESCNRLVNAAVAFMQDHYPEDITLSQVARVIGVTASYLSTLFSHTLGSGFVGCLNRIRIERACDYFFDDRLKNYEVAYRVGFHDEKYFSNVFKKLKGVCPSDYRNSIKGVHNATGIDNHNLSEK